MYSPQLKNTSESKQSCGRMWPVVQPKLTVNRPGDIYEQEADAMADRVMRMSADETFRQPQPATGLIGRSIQRKCPKCEEEEKKKPIMRKAENGAAGIPVSSSFASSLNASKGGGSPLPKDTRSFMEKAFSSDFSSVRIHNDDRASEMSRGISAKAFTTGNDIYFNKGQYNPGSAEGKHLLVHELTHVRQQATFKSSKTLRRVSCPTTSCPGKRPSFSDCSAYFANADWLPTPYVNNATLACLETPDSPTANCVRKTLQDRLATTPSSLKQHARFLKTISSVYNYRPDPYDVYAQGVITPRIYNDHVVSYRTAGCPSGPAPYPAWIGVTTVPMPPGTVGLSIKYGGGSCSGVLGTWC